jgi:hypothetical protein
MKRSEIMTTRKNYVAILAAGVSAAAIAMAPVAAAAPSGPTCVKLTRTASQCEPVSNRHNRVTRPEVSHQTQHPFYGSVGPFGVIRHHMDHG